LLALIAGTVGLTYQLTQAYQMIRSGN